MSCRKSKDSDYFRHYLDHHLGHRGSGRDLGIDIESSEKILDTFEDIDQGVVTCVYILGRLVVPNVSRYWGEDNEENTHGEKDVDAREDRLCRGKRLEDRGSI